MDIVERLRQEIAGYTDGPIENAEADMREAADEIERLRDSMNGAMQHAIKYFIENGSKSNDQLGVVALLLAQGLGLTQKDSP